MARLKEAVPVRTYNAVQKGAVGWALHSTRRYAEIQDPRYNDDMVYNADERQGS